MINKTEQQDILLILMPHAIIWSKLYINHIYQDLSTWFWEEFHKKNCHFVPKTKEMCPPVSSTSSRTTSEQRGEAAANQHKTLDWELTHFSHTNMASLPAPPHLQPTTTQPSCVPAVHLRHQVAFLLSLTSGRRRGGEEKGRMHYDSNVLAGSKRLQSTVRKWCLLPRHRWNVKFFFCPLRE